MSIAFTVSDIIPATPKEIYAAWLDSEKHAWMTGGKHARIDPRIGGTFEVWDGNIRGKTLALEPARRIVQSWRAKRFTEADPDSRIEVILEPVTGGTKVTIRHTNVPDGLAVYRDRGWANNYFAPMKRYFSERKA